MKTLMTSMPLFMVTALFSLNLFCASTASAASNEWKKYMFCNNNEVVIDLGTEVGRAQIVVKSGPLMDKLTSTGFRSAINTYGESEIILDAQFDEAALDASGVSSGPSITAYFHSPFTGIFKIVRPYTDGNKTYAIINVYTASNPTGGLWNIKDVVLSTEMGNCYLAN